MAATGITKEGKEYVLKKAKEHDVKFIRLWFTDILGMLKSFAITVEELEGALEEGMGFDGSSIEGFARIDESDMMALPDPDTFQLLPWRPAGHQAVARMFCDIMRPGGEPFSLRSGTSVWPTAAIRLVAAFTALCLILKAGKDLRSNSDELTEDFLKGTPTAFPGNAAKKAGQQQAWLRTVAGELKKVLWDRGDFNINDWKLEKGEQVDVADLWRGYLHRGSGQNRWRRFLLPSVIYLAFGMLLIFTIGLPDAPYRGAVSNWTLILTLIASVGLMVALIFYVLDATRLCERFIRHLSTSFSKWPDDKARQAGEHKKGTKTVPPPPPADWRDIQLITKRTQAVGRLMLYPVIVIILMIISRSDYFDNWGFPWPIILLASLGMLFALGCGVVLRRAAERARHIAITSLTDKLFTQIREGKKDKPEAEQVRLAIREIESLREGAFAPITQQPVVQAILLPSGGLGGWAIIGRLLQP